VLTRLLAVAIAIATAALLLTGCQTLTKEGYLPPNMRDKAVFQCGSDCYVPVDPSKPQWVYEYIGVNRGGIFRLWLTSGWEFVDPRIEFTKPPAGASVIKCPSHGPAILVCNVDKDADPNVQYGYTIYVRDKVTGKSYSYDPFVWPQ
jgi:hypothetical protein